MANPIELQNGWKIFPRESRPVGQWMLYIERWNAYLVRGDQIIVFSADSALRDHVDGLFVGDPDEYDRIIDA